MHDGHEHDHSKNAHPHEHTHAHDAQDKEMQTLYALIGHWIEHNNSHKASFEEWAQKAKKCGKDKAAEAIFKSVNAINAANDALQEAKNGW